jgi:hypothetical protein
VGFRPVRAPSIVRLETDSHEETISDVPEHEDLGRVRVARIFGEEEVAVKFSIRKGLRALKRRFGYSHDPYLEAGTKVSIRAYKSKPGKGLSYPAFHGVLAEGARVGGWDVVDVRASDGREESVYSFSLSRRR